MHGGTVVKFLKTTEPSKSVRISLVRLPSFSKSFRLFRRDINVGYWHCQWSCVLTRQECLPWRHEGGTHAFHFGQCSTPQTKFDRVHRITFLLLLSTASRLPKSVTSVFHKRCPKTLHRRLHWMKLPCPTLMPNLKMSRERCPIVVRSFSETNRITSRAMFGPGDV